MGNNSSYLGASRLTKDDCDRLARRFKAHAGADGKVSIAEFQRMVELGANPFTGRILELFDTDKDGKLTLLEFTAAMDYFSNLDNADEQFKFAFRIYDLNGDGFISPDELQSTLASLIGGAYQKSQLEQLVTNTMAEFDIDGDGRLNLKEFRALLSVSDLSKFSLPIQH